MSAPARRRRVQAALVVGALLAAEAGGRVLAARAWRPLPPFGDGPVQRAWLERAERDLAAGAAPPGYSAFDAALGWTTRRGYVAPDGRIHVNSVGLRATREYDAEPAPGTRRVIACGESFTFGEEVADDEAWCARLEALVPGLEVLNYGVGGYGTDQALLRFEREARAPAEAVLVGVMSENVGRNVNRYRPLWHPLSQPAVKPRFVVAAGGLELVPQPFATQAELVAAVRSGAVLGRLAEHEHWDANPLPWLEWSALGRVIAGRLAYAARETRPLWADTQGEPFVTSVALLERFHASARAAGIERLIVLFFPARADLGDELAGRGRIFASLAATLAARGIEYLDTTEALAAEARRSGVEALLLESHYSPLGNDVVARAVAARLTAPPEAQASGSKPVAPVR